MTTRMRTVLNRFFIILCALTSVVLPLFTACTASQPETKIDSVKLIMSASVNWDEDIEADGIQFLLIPTDADGWPIRDELTVKASLWSQPDRFRRERGNLMQEWNDIRVTRRTYERYGEARIRLEYEGYVPEPDKYGILDIAVQLKDGRTFPFEEVVSLGYSSSGQGTSGCCY